MANSNFTGTIVDRSCTIAADCLVIGATWIALSPSHPLYRRGILKYSLSDVLLLDGECVDLKHPVFSDQILMEGKSGTIYFVYT